MQARADILGGRCSNQKKRAPIAKKKPLTELKHKQHDTDDAVLNLRLLWAGLDR